MPRFPLSVGLLSCLLLLVGLGGCATRVDVTRPFEPQPFAHEGSDLKPDPAVTWGRLPNGLRYAILPHGTPKQRASVHLHVQAGSVHERDSELGYAHFVEHMAFRDLRGFPQGIFTTLSFLGAGPHSSAVTTPLETLYFFNELPTTDGKSVPMALSLMRAIGDGIVFTPEGVGRERGVIFGEVRSHSDEIGARIRDDLLEFAPPHELRPTWPELAALLHNTRLPHRYPLGVEKTLQAASPAKLRAFYDRWYRPERMVLVVVGDIEPADIERQVREAFSSLTGRGRPPEEPVFTPQGNRGRLESRDQPLEATMNVSLGVVRTTPPRDNLAKRERAVAQKLSLAMLERRLDRAAEQPDPPFISSSAFVSHLAPGLEMPLIRGATKPARWRDGMQAIDFEVNRILKQGFTVEEFQAASREERLRLAAGTRQAGLRHSGEIASALAASIRYGVVFTAPAADQQHDEHILDQLNAESCHRAFREMLADGEWTMVLSGPMSAASKPISIGFKESRSGEFPRYEPPAPPIPFPHTDFGTPGKVVKNERFEAIDTQMLQFANGVRLNLRRTTFEPGRVRLDLRLGGGMATLPVGKSILGWRSHAWIAGGLQGLTAEQERAALVEVYNDAHFDPKSTSISLGTINEAQHLPLLFQMAAAYLTRPAFRSSSEARMGEFLHNSLLQANGSARNVGSGQLTQRMTGGHPAYEIPQTDDLGRSSVSELKNWLLPQLASAPIEIGVIGDFDAPTVIDAAARTVGALPTRDSFESLEPARKVAFPPKPFSETIAFKSTSGLSVVTMAWPILNTPRYPAQFHAHLVADILEQRLWQRFRQEMGESYFVKARLFMDETLSPRVTFLQCLIDAAPGREVAVAAAAREIEASLREHGATAEELERARQPLIRNTETGLRHNGWWLDVITFAQSDPEYAHGWLGAKASYESATLEDINAALKRWLDPARRCEVIAKPRN